VTTDYQLCIYDGASNLLFDAAIPGGGMCGTSNPQPCWKEVSAGFNYKDKDKTPDGVEQLTLRAGVATKAKVQIKGKGVALDDPAYELMTPVTVQLHNTEGICWGAVYSAPALKSTAPAPGSRRPRGWRSRS
jgi:hypothetical protein